MAFNEISLQNLKTNTFSSDNQPTTKGRKKGSINRSTKLSYYLDALSTRGNPLTQQDETLPVYDHVILSLIKRALDGSEVAIAQILDTLHGKIGSPQVIDTPQDYDYNALPVDILAELVQLEARRTEILNMCRVDKNSHIESIEVITDIKKAP